MACTPFGSTTTPRKPATIPTQSSGAPTFAARPTRSLKKRAHGGNMVSPLEASRRRSGMQTELESAVGEVLIDRESLGARIAELGAEISVDYAGRDLLLIGVLKGAVFFMADLMRKLTIPCEVDFMAISSYGASTDSSGVVRILKDL